MNAPAKYMVRSVASTHPCDSLLLEAAMSAAGIFGSYACKYMKGLTIDIGKVLAAFGDVLLDQLLHDLHNLICPGLDA